MSLLSIKRTHSYGDNDGQVASISDESGGNQGRQIVLTVLDNGKLAEHTFTAREWLSFIIGTFDVIDMLEEAKIIRLLRAVLRKDEW